MLKGKTALVTGSTSGIGLGLATAFAREGCNIVLNGLGAGGGHREDSRRSGQGSRRHRSSFSGRHAEARRDRRHGRRRREGIRRDRHPLQQRRHPARGAGRRIPGREMERDHRHQPVLGVLHHPRGAAEDEGEEMGPHHQHRERARAGRLAVQVGLRRRQARHRRADQDRGAGSGGDGHHRQRHLAGVRVDAAGRETDPGSR